MLFISEHCVYVYSTTFLGVQDKISTKKSCEALSKMESALGDSCMPGQHFDIWF